MSRHVVVDGSNLATEGRSLPSLHQLNEAVLAYLEENPNDIITVVVDATFGHRIDAKEVAEFDEAIENNELVSPPAGAIGRGDAFVLQIAKKAHAIILSNDSFQEFHGEHEWLFDEGRLIGGKPVPHVGWVFVPRAPVRGMISRRATRVAKRDPKVAARPSVSASQPMPVPKSPPPGRRGPRMEAPAAAPAAAGVAEPKPSRSQVAAAKAAAGPKPAAPAAPKGNPANELMAFLGFVEHHPVGTTIDATFESYSSHGAYAVTADGVHIYVPMRSMAVPAPRSAREVVALGEKRAVIIVSFNAARRGIDAALPGFAPGCSSRRCCRRAEARQGRRPQEGSSSGGQARCRSRRGRCSDRGGPDANRSEAQHQAAQGCRVEEGSNAIRAASHNPHGRSGYAESCAKKGRGQEGRSPEEGRGIRRRRVEGRACEEGSRSKEGSGREEGIGGERARGRFRNEIDRYGQACGGEGRRRVEARRGEEGASKGCILRQESRTEGQARRHLRSSLMPTT